MFLPSTKLPHLPSTGFASTCISFIAKLTIYDAMLLLQHDMLNKKHLPMGYKNYKAQKQ